MPSVEAPPAARPGCPGAEQGGGGIDMVLLTKEGVPRLDVEPGRCRPCRDGRCAACASDSCSCPDKRKHRSRPGFAGRTNGAPASPANGSGDSQLAAPVFQLVKADPPEKVRKPSRTSLIEKVRPLLEQLMAAGERDWHRIALYPKARAAAPNKGRLAKAYGEFEWRAVRLPEVDQSAIYVRWTGSGRVLS
jgi:hypothetical protein